MVLLCVLYLDHEIIKGDFTPDFEGFQETDV